ncbi:glycosyltransferase [Paracrocinitomix mangrovi]|uniref:glycosyltransferase n=1 Tax=Paracrocinitomix mangrovi TaxID=2862509 RepID=UPI001C8EA7E2|nr:glycosyltransferase [Paracrocinitomix mangrovi]UKN02579.1 glycosyltransferase [Paracrocinitomix mangrovi]
MNFYLNKYGFLPPQLAQNVAEDTEIIVVIPCFNEPDLITSLQSIKNCIRPKGAVEVIVVINSGEHHQDDIKSQNLKSIESFNSWNQSEDWINFFLIHQPNLPKKHAGVGLARKIGMDEAVTRFDKINKDGIIVCFDADSQCDPNYLVEIENHFNQNPKSPACSIYFEHPLNGTEYSQKIYEGIINYELHLRYYKQCFDYCGLPYNFHTVGSSMAVRSSAYQKQGGMNKRKAGEDFYFIHKIIQLGNFTELNSTRVIPSPRTSDRVPFGTGKAIADWMETEEEEYFTYNFEIFKQIKVFISLIPEFFESEVKIDDLPIHTAYKLWLKEVDFLEKLHNVKSNSTSYESFQKRLFQWFDAFTVLKLVHYLRDNGFDNQIIENEVEKLLGIEGSKLDLLNKSRLIDRKQ